MSKRPRVLYLAPCWPHDQAFGGQLRALHIGRALQQFGDVTLTVVMQDDIDENVRRRTAAEFKVDPPIRIDLKPNRTLIEHWRCAFDPRYLNLHGFTANREDRQRFIHRRDDFDLVWILKSRPTNILAIWDWPHTVLDIDDVPSTFERTFWENGTMTKEKWKAGARMLLMRRRERHWKERFTTLAVCSEADRTYLNGGDQMHVIPNGFVRPEQAPERCPVNPPRIGFIGLYSYLPNLEGVHWFLRECWPQIKREIPGVRLRLVGKDTDGPLKPNVPNVDALGWIEDFASEISTWSAMIIPVHLGAGTRIKLVDAFSRKCPVVSTRLGAFGYDVQDGRELLLADDSVAFATACVSMILDRAKAAAMAERAYQTFLVKWTWDAITPRVWAAAEDCLRRSRK